MWLVGYLSPKLSNAHSLNNLFKLIFCCVVFLYIVTSCAVLWVKYTFKQQIIKFTTTLYTRDFFDPIFLISACNKEIKKMKSSILVRTVEKTYLHSWFQVKA